MPEPTTGIAAFSAVAGVAGANSARKDAKNAQRQAAAADKEALDFAKSQYNDWKNIFGPIQQNLSSYYQNLTPGRIEAQGREAIELERNDWMTRIDETFQQRGLGDTAMEAFATADVEKNVALQKAEVRATAPEKVAQQQLSFLTLGYNQNPAGTLQQTMNNRSSMQQQTALYKGERAGEAIGNAVSTVGTALGDYFGDKKI
jgi:hypothetical protein